LQNHGNRWRRRKLYQYFNEADCYQQPQNDRKGKKIIQIENDELVGFLRKGLGKYLILNNNGILYQSSSAFKKMFKKEFNDCTLYCLRKAVSSRYIAEGDIERLKS
jgi:hypothetical protein